MRPHKPREIEIKFDHMFDESLADGRKVMTRRPVKVDRVLSLSLVEFWKKSDSIYGRWEGYDQYRRHPVIHLQSPIGEPGDWFSHETTGGEILTFEVVGLRIEKLWNMPEHEAQSEGFSSTVEFLKAWHKFYPVDSPYSARGNPWVWANEFRRMRQGEDTE